ncbi:unnamed protein product [Closterium sp. Yama58-4]|nr:unnamed protein product [Closterium sp. Yama58-4]
MSRAKFSTTMERRTPAPVFLLLCAAFLTAVAASTLPPFPLRDGSVLTAASAAQAKPSVWKGKAIIKYVNKLRPTKINGKVVGDKGAFSKLVLSGVRYSATYYGVRVT